MGRIQHFFLYYGGSGCKFVIRGSGSKSNMDIFKFKTEKTHNICTVTEAKKGTFWAASLSNEKTSERFLFRY